MPLAKFWPWGYHFFKTLDTSLCFHNSDSNYPQLITCLMFSRPHSGL